MKKIILIILFSYFTLQAQGKFNFFLDDDEFVYAVDLNGTNEYAQDTSPADVDLSAKTFTIVAWVKVPNPVLGTTIRTIISTDANPTRGWGLIFNNLERWAFINSQTATGSFAVAEETRAGTWTFIAIECTSYVGGVSGFIWYLDGSAVSCNGCSDGVDVSSGASKLSIGRDGFSQNFYFPSQIGQIQIISGYALTQGEITELYNRGGRLKPSYGGGTVVAWYKWDGKTDAEMLNDYSASGNDLTGTNVTTADQVKIGTTYK